MGLYYQTVHQTGEFLSSDWQTITNNYTEFTGSGEGQVNPFPNSFDDYPNADFTSVGAVDQKLHLWNGRLLTQWREAIFFEGSSSSFSYYPMGLRRRDGSWETIGDGFRSFLDDPELPFGASFSNRKALNNTLGRTVYEGDIYAAFSMVTFPFSFSSSGTERIYIVKWNPSAEEWEPLSPNTEAFVFNSGSLSIGGEFVTHNGDLYLIVSFPFSSTRIFRYNDNAWQALENPQEDSYSFQDMNIGRLVKSGSKVWSFTSPRFFMDLPTFYWIDLDDLSSGNFANYKYIGSPNETIFPPPFRVWQQNTNGWWSDHSKHRLAVRESGVAVLNSRAYAYGSSLGGEFIDYTDTEESFQFSTVSANSEYAVSRQVIAKPGLSYETLTYPISYERDGSVEYVLFSPDSDDPAWVYKNTSEGWINVGGPLNIGVNREPVGTITKLGNALYFSNGPVIKRTRA
jgi:hypothetical protein